MTQPIHTIGHSNYLLSSFFHLLERHRITKVVDVRSYPSSRYLPHFNRPNLTKSLRDQGIEYIFMGDTLGGRPSDPALYDERGQVDYARVRDTQAFNKALQDLLALSQETPTAIMCTERDPLKCHRTLMVAAALEAIGHDTQHIQGKDGHTISHKDLVDQLVATLPPPLRSTPQDNLRERAIRVQASRHAFVKRT